MKAKGVLFIISIIIIFTLILSITIQEFAPKPVISDTKNISIWKVIYYGTEISVDEDKQNFYMKSQGNHNGSEISLDENELIDILSKYSSKKTFQSYFPYQSDKIDIEIEIVENYRPKHILLGEFNIWYESADKGSYNILNGQQLIDELKSIIENHLNVE